jgi:peptide/nickel transport system substrate-binding protein
MLRARRRGSGRGRVVLGGCVAASAALILAACGPVGAGSSASVGTTPVSGGVASYATLPGLNVTYIFPFDGGVNFTATNSDQLQYLLYRPLYWFGQGASPYLNTKVSLAYPPVYRGRQVTITLKKYMWSDGKPVTAQDVMFWINMQIEDGATYFGGQVQGDFPDDVAHVHAQGANKVVMTITKPYSENWFTYNELSQITPMPAAWDRTATGPSHCDIDAADCTAVYTYLAKQAGNPATWAGSKLWSVVDGPWRVKSARSGGYVDFVVNKSYSGPLPTHHISEFVVEPFTSEQAEFNVLQDPQGNQKVDVGYLPTVDAPVPAPGSAVGPNPVTLSDYKLSVIYPWALSYFPYNYSDPTAGPIFKQLYFRQAFQYLVDQEGVVDGPMHGYGKVTIGPVSNYPATKYLSSQVAANGDQWQLNPTKAAALLRQNGWSIVPGGTDRCVRPGSGRGDCGPGVRAGAQLSFTFDYANGIDWMYSSTKELVSNASLVGIKINDIGEPIQDVIGAAFCSPAPGQPPCPHWQLAQWGSWTFSPDYVPTGEELFEPTSIDDAGGYDSPANNALITKTLTAKTPGELISAMDQWENYLSPQLPVVYEPNVATLVETVDNLHIGVQDPTLTINPEDWYYLK